MTRQPKPQYKPTDVSAPGETLRELLEEKGISQADLAMRMGRPQKTISEILNGKAAITTETALGLELVLGVPASFWLAREAAFRESLARHEFEKGLESAQSWAKNFPISRMERFGWLPKSSDSRQRTKALLEFFGVASANQWDELYASTQVAFRHSTKFSSDKYALSAWLRAGLRMAQAASTALFDRQVFLSCLNEARSLTRELPSVFSVLLPEKMAPAGVVVVFVPELPQSRASGATRWITPNKAIIQLSLRYKTDDHLWFTFFHEAAHILFHSKKSIFIELNGHKGDDEDEANRWAADFLIPPIDMQALMTWPTYTKPSVEAFAAKVGVSPGIVVGRLQHEGRIPHSYLNDLKLRLDWAE